MPDGAERRERLSGMGSAGSALRGSASPLGAAPFVLCPAQLRREYLAAQCPLDKVRGTRGFDQPAALGSVGSQHRLHAAKLQLVAELRARTPVPLSLAPPARCEVMAGQP